MPTDTLPIIAQPQPVVEKKRTTAGRLMLNSLCGVSVTVVTALVSIFLTPYILRQMGDQRYGVWAVLGSVYAYSMVLQFGLYSAINRHIPMYLARQEDDKIREVTSTTTAFFLLLGLFVATVTFVFAKPILGMFTIPAELMPAARIGLYTVGIVAALTLSLNAASAILSGYQRY